MRPCITTVFMDGLLRHKLGAIAAAGCDAIELFETEVVVSERLPEEIVVLARDLGLAIAALQPLRDFEVCRGLWRGRALDRAHRRIELAVRHGPAAGLLGVHRAAEDFRDLGDIAAGGGRDDRRRGAGLGPAHPRLARRLGGGAARRPSRGRPGAAERGDPPGGAGTAVAPSGRAEEVGSEE